MLIRCQVCGRSISDSANSCPGCSAPRDTFFGSSASCAECAGDYYSAYPNCSHCGAPRTVALRAIEKASKEAIDPPASGSFNPHSQQKAALSADDLTSVAPIQRDVLNEGNVRQQKAAAPEKKAANPPKKSNGGLIGGFLACLAAVGAFAAFIIPKVVGGAIGYSAAQAVRSSAPAVPTKEAIGGLWGKLESDPAMGTFLKEFRISFPEEQDRFIDAYTQHLKTSSNPSQDAQFGYDWMRAFTLRNAHFVAQASDEALSEMADQAVRLGLLLQNEDVARCAKFVMDGDIGPGGQNSNELKYEAGQSSVLMLKAIKSGKLNRIQRSDPTEEQVAVFAEAIIATGLEPALFDAFGDGSISTFSQHDQCSAGISVMKAMAEMPSRESAFWMAYNTSEGAKASAR